MKDSEPATLSFEPNLNIADLIIWFARLMEVYNKKEEEDDILDEP